MIDNDFSVDMKIKEKLMNENSIVPQNIHKIIIETGQNTTTKRAPKAVLRLVVASLLIFTVGFTSLRVLHPTYMQNLPVIGPVFEALEHMVFSDYGNYSPDINISNTYDGYKVTVNSVAYDGLFLAMSYTIESKSPFPFTPNRIEFNCEINGKDSGRLGGDVYISSLTDDKKSYSGITEVVIPEGYLISSGVKDNNSTSNNDIPYKFNIKINITGFYNLGYENGKFTTIDKLAGDWKFNTSITNEKLKGKVNEIKTAVNLDKVEKELKINKLITTPQHTILYGASPKRISKPLHFFVYDNNGRGIFHRNVYFNNNCMFVFKEIYNDTKTLTFIPYMREPKLNVQPEFFSANLNLKGKTFVPLGKHGNLEITKVEVSNGKTNIYYIRHFEDYAKPEIIVDKATNEKIYIQKFRNYDEAKHEYYVSIDTELKNKKYIILCSNFESVVNIFDDQKFTITVKK